MTWNGPVTIHDDLRRLHESGRASDTSREIGYSSITQGEGSLDVISQAGLVHAQIGDQDDGRLGVSVRHGGALRFIPDLVQELQDEDVALSNRISGLGDRMVSAEGRLDGHDSTLASHNSRITTAQARADKGVSDAAAAQSSANAAQSSANTAQARADSAYSRAGTGISNAATAQSRADAAYALADGRATSSEVDQIRSNLASLTDAVADWISDARQAEPNLPPWPGA